MDLGYGSQLLHSVQSAIYIRSALSNDKVSSTVLAFEFRKKITTNRQSRGRALKSEIHLKDKE
jgi:hypothetical protein